MQAIWSPSLAAGSSIMDVPPKPMSSCSHNEPRGIMIDGRTRHLSESWHRADLRGHRGHLHLIGEMKARLAAKSAVPVARGGFQ